MELTEDLKINLDSSNSISNPNNKTEIPKKTLYLGLLITESLEKIYDLLIKSLKTILEYHPNISDANNLLSLLEGKTLENPENYKFPWKYPKDYKKWHVTTLFKKGASLKKFHPAYINFEEGAKNEIDIRGK